MEDGSPSRTAEGAAIMRALHQTLDGNPKILDDPIAPRLVDRLSDAYQSRVDLLERLPPPVRARLKATFVMRCRYAEDCLADAVRRGVLQYLILGAGLDTFAYRQPDWAQTLRIFEVDHPATQKWKRARLAAANVPLPSNLSLVPIDFEKSSLVGGLSGAGFDPDAPAVVALLGVSMYLSEGALSSTLRFVRSLPASSELILSFVLPDHALPPEEVALAQTLAARVATYGEPVLSRFTPEELSAKLTSMGFSKVFHLSPEEANRRYFANRSDGLSASLLEQMMSAAVP